MKLTSRGSVAGQLRLKGDGQASEHGKKASRSALYPATSNESSGGAGEKDKRMRYSILDILMTMALVALVAASAGPRFSKASLENRLSEMVDGLYAVRSQIERYRVEHNGLLPGQTSPGGHVSPDAFAEAVTRPDASGRGPWLRAIPANPFMTGDKADDVTCVNAAGASPTGDEGTGWWFNAATGEFRACDNRFHAEY